MSLIKIRAQVALSRALALALCLFLATGMFAAENGYKVTYDGGSIPGIKTGNAMKLLIEENRGRLMRDKEDVVTSTVALALPSDSPLYRLASGRSWH